MVGTVHFFAGIVLDTLKPEILNSSKRTGMKYYLLSAFSFLLVIACSDANQGVSKDQPVLIDTAKKADGSYIPGSTTPEVPAVLPDSLRAGTHPISLQWIGWDRPGKATLTPDSAGWYGISGSQLNADREYLNIDGRIRRVSDKELEFIGTVETRTRVNNGGEPCIKKGKQRFFAKGARTYYRLQNMENCQGGNVLDYVDIYAGTSSL